MSNALMSNLFITKCAVPVMPDAEIPEHRAFGDSDKTRQLILDGVHDAVSKAYPIENTRYRLQLDGIHYDNNEPFTLQDQKKAIMQGASLSHRLLGNWNLYDKESNKLLDTKKTTVAHVPYMTNRGTFIHKGNEYTIANQMRLKPGIFSRVKDNGLIEAHINTRPGTGPGFRVYMEPDTGVMRLSVGQSTLKMYPILRAMGVSDKDMEKYWGREILQANVAAEDPRAVSRAYAKLVNTRFNQEDDDANEATIVPSLAKNSAADDKDDEVGRKEVTPADRAALVKHVAESDDLDDEKMHEFYAELGLNPHAAETALYEELHARMGSVKGEMKEMEKGAKIGARESDRKWSKLWFTGTIRAERGHGGKPWVYVEVHRGLIDSALASLKSEGFQVERTPNEPHITLLRSNEAKSLVSKFGETQWKGAAKDGTKVRFALCRLVNLVPVEWDGVDRVWFIELESPDLEKYRKDLGFTTLPRHENTDHEHRFHITFAVHHPKSDVKRAYDLFTHARAFAMENMLEKKAAVTDHGKGLLEVFNRMGLDPDVTEATLGERHENVSIPMLLRTSQKLLNISRKKEEVDDRDSLAFQTFHGPEDFFSERILKDAGQVGRKMLWRSTLRGNVQHIPNGALSGQLTGVLIRSGMGATLEETNPMEIFDQNLRVLRLGEGGISCHSEDTEVLTFTGWKFWPEVTEDDALATEVDGALTFRRPNRLFQTPYRGTMLRGVTDRVDYLVTPNHRMYVRHMMARGGWSEFTFRTADDIHGVRVRHKIATGPFVGGEQSQIFELEPAPVEKSNAGSQRLEPRVFTYADWVQLLGYYLADGSYAYALDRKEYRVEIGKKRDKNPVEYELIASLLQRMDIPHRYEQERRFVITGKEFAHYFRQFGKSREKFVPEEIMRGDLFVRGLMFDAITQMDHSGKYEEGHVFYASASEKLRDQVAFLAITLGWSVTYYTRENEFEAPRYQALCRNALETGVMRQHHGLQYQTVDYDGNVYCADMGGGLLLTRRNGKTLWSGNSLDAVPQEARNVQPSQFGYIDPVRAPESAKIGVDSRVSHVVVKGKNGQIYTQMRSARSGQPIFISPQQASKSVVTFPGELDSGQDKVRAMVRSRQVEYVDRKDVDYELPHTNQTFTATSNMVPFTSAIMGGRLLMGAKYVTQALPLKHAEAPLVQNLATDTESFDDVYGVKVGAVRAKDLGVVRSIDKDGITLAYKNGKKETHEFYNNFPFNRKTFIHNTPLVKIGDTVKPGQLLAKSNYTDDAGTLAIGTNLRVGYMPYKGLNFEDAIVLSESGARKLTSEHMYQKTIEGEDNRQVSRKAFVSIYPMKFTRKQLETIGDNGVIKPGTSVKMGDPLVLSVDRSKPTAVHKGHKPLFSDSAVTWDHESDGMVTDVDQTEDGGWNVTVKSYSPMQEGDKLAGRYGDKGVVSRIIPDDQMIHDKDGKPLEVLLNPQGIISRGNPAQIHEALLSKVARKRGSAYRVPAFMSENLIDYVKGELSKNGLSDTEDLYDPADGGVKIPAVLTGERFMYKLHHTAESKGRGRDIGAYTSEGLPAKGGEFGSKRVSSMEQNALISHGATEVLRDAQVVRGQRNDDYWRAFRLGYTPPSPKVPFVYEKFMAMLTGAGINVQKNANSQQLFALTDKDIDKLSSGPIKNARTVEHDDLKEISGGLFDRSVTGGHGGSRWAHVDLAEPIPNPVMEEPIRRLLGLTQKGYEAVIKGDQDLNGEVGGKAIRDGLSRINVESSISYYSDIVKNGPKSKRDNAVKVLGYLKTAQKYDIEPKDWVLSKVPVLPPHFRPITKFKDLPLVADPNYLYQDLIRSNGDLAEMTGVVGERQMGRERLRLYNAFKAVAGLGDPVQAKTQEKQAKGLLKHVFGDSPKLGLFQRRVMGSPVDIVGRATITPNPELGMDQVGLPEPKAWTIYRPFVMRRLIRSGMPAMQAAQEVYAQTQRAKSAMLSEMKERPVLINRAPTLHRYGFMSAWPVLTKGETLQVPPVIVNGFNADFDGDAMNYHVPVTDAAVKEAIEKMMPSKNLKSVSDFGVHYLPRQEFLLGLYLASSVKSDKRPRVFRSKEDVLRAHQHGEIGLTDPVIIRG